MFFNIFFIQVISLTTDKMVPGLAGEM